MAETGKTDFVTNELMNFNVCLRRWTVLTTTLGTSINPAKPKVVSVSNSDITLCESLSQRTEGLIFSDIVIILSTQYVRVINLTRHFKKAT